MITQIIPPNNLLSSGIPLRGKKQIALIIFLVLGFCFSRMKLLSRRYAGIPMCFFIAILLSGLVSQCYAQNFASKEEKIVISPPQKSLKIGEKLQYSVEWLGIPVGKIILTVQDIKEINGNECYHIVGCATPNSFFTKLYDVEYTVHTYIDKKTFYTHRFEKIRRIKDKFSYVVIEFDRQKKEVRYQAKGYAPLLEFSRVREEAEVDIPATFKIINGTQDLFSSLYYLRLLEIEKKGSSSLTIYYDQRNWPVKAKAEEPLFREIRNIGTFAVFRVSLDSNLGKFILGKSKMFVYFTADSRRIPIEFKFGTGIGSIQGRIQNISN